MWRRDEHWPVPMPTWAIVAVLAAAAFAIFSRRPGDFLDPQFWAEDGAHWYGDAYNLGRFKALTIPDGSYYQTFSRLGGAFAACFPLAWGPAITNTMGLSLQLLPIFFLLAGRLDNLIPDWRAKLLVAALYVAIPYSSEWSINLTQGQLRLALLATLVAIATPPPNRAWKAFDIGAVVVSGLTGPYALMLVPVLLLRLAVRRERWVGLLAGLSACCAAIQGISILTANQRPGSAIGWQPHYIANWLGGQIGIGLILGEHGYGWAEYASWWSGAVPYLVAGLVVALAAWAAWRGPLEVRMLILWAVLLVVATFAGKQIVVSDGYWTTLPGIGIRYRILPSFVLLAVLLWLAFRSRGWARLVPGALLVVMLVAIPFDWEYFHFHDFHFRQQVQQFERAPAGTRMMFPLNPPGFGPLILVKKA